MRQSAHSDPAGTGAHLARYRGLRARPPSALPPLTRALGLEGDQGQCLPPRGPYLTAWSSGSQRRGLGELETLGEADAHSPAAPGENRGAGGVLEILRVFLGLKVNASRT